MVMIKWGRDGLPAWKCDAASSYKSASSLALHHQLASSHKYKYTIDTNTNRNTNIWMIKYFASHRDHHQDKILQQQRDRPHVDDDDPDVDNDFDDDDDPYPRHHSPVRYAKF